MLNGQFTYYQYLHNKFRWATIYPRGVHSLKHCVTNKQYKKIINFPYLESKKEVDKFSDWIKSLGIPKVQGKLSFFTVHTTSSCITLSLVGPQGPKHLDPSIFDQVSLKDWPQWLGPYTIHHQHWWGAAPLDQCQHWTEHASSWSSPHASP